MNDGLSSYEYMPITRRTDGKADGHTAERVGAYRGDVSKSGGLRRESAADPLIPSASSSPSSPLLLLTVNQVILSQIVEVRSYLQHGGCANGQQGEGQQHTATKRS